jgi:phage protein D
MAETPTTRTGTAFERPTIRVDEREFATVDELMLGLEMTEREGGLSTLELRVSNVASFDAGDGALAFEDDSVLKLGAALAVYGGDVTEPREVFRGTITGLEAEFPADGAPTLVALAEDVFQRARMARRTKLHENVTIDRLARDLASRLGLTPVVTELSRDLGSQIQLNESDLAFLRRLLARHDGDMQVVGTELHVAPRAEVQRGTLELELHSQLRRARVLADLAHQVTGVSVRGWNPAEGAAVLGSSGGTNLGPGRGRTGAQLLRQALGERAHNVAHLAVATDSEARALSEAAFDERARRLVLVDGTADGNPALRVGTHVSLSGMGGRFDNTYYVTFARHRWDESRGYETDFLAECAFFGAGG